MPNIDSSATSDNSAITPGTNGFLPGMAGHASCPVFNDCEKHLYDNPLFGALAMIDALCDVYENAKSPRIKSRIVKEIHAEAIAAIKTHNV